MSKLITLILVIMLMSACGFHLRGASSILDKYNPLVVERNTLTINQYNLSSDMLTRAGAKVSATTLTDNQLIIKFIPLKTRKLVDSNLSGVELIQLALRLEFRVQKSNGDILLEQQILQQTQEVELDTNNVLSQESVLALGNEELERKLLRGMIFRLSNL